MMISGRVSHKSTEDNQRVIVLEEMFNDHVELNKWMYCCKSCPSLRIALRLHWKTAADIGPGRFLFQQLINVIILICVLSK